MGPEARAASPRREFIHLHRLEGQFVEFRQAVDMDIFGSPGAETYPYSPPAGAPGRRFPGGGYG
eukprot:5644044-Pyramimonas_sp.AAC.1